MLGWRDMMLLMVCAGGAMRSDCDDEGCEGDGEKEEELVLAYEEREADDELRRKEERMLLKEVWREGNDGVRILMVGWGFLEWS